MSTNQLSGIAALQYYINYQKTQLLCDLTDSTCMFWKW